MGRKRVAATVALALVWTLMWAGLAAAADPPHFYRCKGSWGKVWGECPSNCTLKFRVLKKNGENWVKWKPDDPAEYVTAPGWTWPWSEVGEFRAQCSCKHEPTEDAHWTIAANYTIVDVDVVASADYMVPKSSKNVIRYTWEPYAVFTPDSARLEVYDKNNTLIRTITGLPTAHATGENYAEHSWNACSDQGGTTPLSEAASPYKLVVVLAKNGQECKAEVSDRRVKEWYLTLQVKDEEAYSGATVSKIDKDSVTKADSKLIVKRSFVGEPGSEQEIPQYATSEDGNHVNAVLKTGGGATDYYLFYTTPTTPADVEIRYQVTAKTSDDGCVDKAKNQWDMDSSTSDVWENKGEWQFKLDSSGNMTSLAEDYSREN